MNINDTTQPGLFFCPHVDQTSPSVSSTCVTPTCSKYSSVCVCPPPWTSHSSVTAMIYGHCARKQAWWAHYSYVQASFPAVWRQKPKGCVLNVCRETERERVCMWLRERERARANSCFTSAQPAKLIEQDGGNRSSDFKSGHDVSGKTEFCSEWALLRASLPPLMPGQGPVWLATLGFINTPVRWRCSKSSKSCLEWADFNNCGFSIYLQKKKNRKVKINRKQLFQRSIRDRKSRQISLGSSGQRSPPPASLRNHEVIFLFGRKYISADR